ncbi:hypothetical protein STSR3_48 [Salmonella virus STSR3]|nr:hypothetical protein STSR3_48 [Salmonella virus STSR3]
MKYTPERLRYGLDSVIRQLASVKLDHYLPSMISAGHSGA